MKWKVKLKHFFGTSHTIPVQISQGADIAFALSREHTYFVRKV